MKIKTALKIMKKTQKNYEKIATEFAKTRQSLWPELKIFSNYIKDGDKILDIGCGSGRLVDLLESYPVIDYIGIDNCQGLIEHAQKNYPDENFINQDILDLQFSPKAFNVVFSIAVLNHFPKPLHSVFMNNIRRIIKPGGYLLMTNWNLWGLKKKKSIYKYNFSKFLTSAKKFKQKHGISKQALSFKDILTTWRKNEKKGYLYYYAFSLRELRKIVKRNGFDIVEAFYSNNGKKTNIFTGGNIVLVCKKR